MIRDMHEIDTTAPLEADVCIIGSGAVGTAIALEFLSTPFRVIVLEAGGPQREEESQEPYRSQVIGTPHVGIHTGRARVYGGTTTLWAGQALPLMPIDFEERDWVPYSGWPIRREELLRFYRRAEAVMEVNSATYGTDTWPRPDHPPPAYDPSLVAPLYTQFTLTPDFRDKYRERIQNASNVELIVHANVVGLEATPNADAVREIRVRSLDGPERKVRARYVVVACGGIETARLLLISDSVETQGLGNQHDVVGRFFQDHPHYVIEGVKPRNPHQFDMWFNTLVEGRVRYALKLAASVPLQRSERILGVAGEIYYPTDADDPVAAARQVMAVLRGQGKSEWLLPALGRVARQPQRVMNEVILRTVKQQAVSAGTVKPQFVVGCEQEPNPASRVMLSEERDRLGLRRTALDWKVSAAEGKTLEVFLRAVAAEWQRLGIGELDLSKMDLSAPARALKDSYHHIGTTRMGTDPKVSVVDTHCRVHGYDNLYLASSAVFPTGGFSNPTLTAISLGLRTADEIKLALAR